MDEPKKILYFFLILLPFTALDGAVGIIFIVKDWYPFIPLMINIPKEYYYIAEMFFFGPVTYLNIILAAGIIQVMLYAFKAQQGVAAKFENTLMIATYGLLGPLFIWNVYDLAFTLLMVFNIMPHDWFYKHYQEMGIPFFVNLVIVIIGETFHFISINTALTKVYNLSKIKSIFITLFVMVVFFVGWLVLFIR